MKRYLIILVFLLVVGGAAWLVTGKAKAPSAPATARTRQTTKPSVASFDKTTYSLTDPTSLWIVVNKHHQLNPKDYVPADLVQPDVAKRSNITDTERQVRSLMAGPLKTMFDAAGTTGITLNLQSGYRSYPFQVTLYNGYVASQGQATADTQSARPGYSEHQTGLAADIGGISNPSCNVEACYADTPEGKWLAANAYKYGFIIRYPSDKTPVTGYTYEPWHVRYIGIDLSNELHARGVETLEEFFGLGAAPDYQ